MRKLIINMSDMTWCYCLTIAIINKYCTYTFHHNIWQKKKIFSLKRTMDQYLPHELHFEQKCFQRKIIKMICSFNYQKYLLLPLCMRMVCSVTTVKMELNYTVTCIHVHTNRTCYLKQFFKTNFILVNSYLNNSINQIRSNVD